MHEKSPFGLFVRSGELTDDDLDFIHHFASKVLNFKQLSNLESIKYTRELPNGGMALFIHAGGTFRVIVFKSTEQKTERSTGIAPSKIPMLFSGVITRAVVSRGQGVELTLTDQCCRRVGNYGGYSVDASQVLKRLRSKYNPMHYAMFVPQDMQGIDENIALYSQYDKLRPTWYSGAMAEVVQIASGLGRQNLEEMPEDYVERAEFVLPNNIQAKIEDTLKNVRLPGYTGVPHKDGTIEYNFTFQNTNLVSFDADGYPWLIQIDSSGVWAMPLPMIPATMTDEFREYVEQVNDTELLKVLDRFKGIPSGETFPSNRSDWWRAGAVFRVCDSSDFHSHSAYTSACGWSSNRDGTAAINTCYDFEESGLCVGFTYQLSLALNALPDRGLLKQKTLEGVQNPGQVQQIGNYLSRLFAEIEDDTEPSIVAMMYKIRLIPHNEILSRVYATEFKSEIEYWKNYTIENRVSHTAKLVRTNNGYLNVGVPFKLPEPFAQGCVHMDFRADKPDAPEPPPCDTIIFGYYIGDILKVIKSFSDNREMIEEAEGNFEDLMVVGNWEKRETIGRSGLHGKFYSTDFDDRRVLPATEITTLIEGRDKGYGTPHIRYSAVFAMDATLTRQRFYTHKKNIDVKASFEFDVAFVVPYFCRNGVIYSKRETYNTGGSYEEVTMHSMGDPNYYRAWTYDRVWHVFMWSGMTAVKQTGKPYPVNSDPVWCEEYYHSPYYGSEFADEGDWIGGLPADISSIANPPGDITILEYGGVPPTAEIYRKETAASYEKKYETYISFGNRPRLIHTQVPNSQYFGFSPDPLSGYVLYEDMCKVVFGNTEYLNMSVKDAGGNRVREGYCKLAKRDITQNFIGVINE